jgi:RNA polymerase sigma factor (sigma-70 family)
MDRTAVRGKAAPAVEEARLARAAAAGDGSAFATLYERYEQRAFNLAYRIAGSEADAADAVQEAFLDAMRRLPRLAEQELAFGPYLFAATRSACHELMRKRPRTRPSETIPEPRQGEVREASMRLPERQREVLALRDLEELSYDEIAAIMEVNGNTVAQLISRARINLRDEMRGTALASVAAPSPECERALPLIATRDDGQLEAGSRDAAWLDAHLADCHRCRLGVEAMQEADASYRAWAPIAAVPWLLKETMAKAAEVAGADWSEAIADAWAAHAPAESPPGTPSAYRAGPGGGKRPRRRLTLAAGLAALLLLAGVAAALVSDNPPATPADSTTGAAPGKSARAPKAGKGAKTAKTKAGGARRKKKARRRTAAAETIGGEAASAPAPTPVQASSGGGASQPASHPSRPSGKTAVQPTRQTSAPKPSSKPKPAAAPTTASQTTSAPAPAPAPAAEEPTAGEETPSERTHGHEPPGKPDDRPPR